jgi:DNA-directed RNA polymerase subunit M/transcription elongation factor TFIIS
MIATLLLAAAVAIPNGFLLYDKASAKKDDNPEHSWEVSRRTSAKLVVNPCNRASLARSGRTAARTLIYTAVPDYSKSEQVILYTSAAKAKKAMRDVRAAVRTCGKKTYRYSAKRLRLGDESLAVVGQAYYRGKPAIGGERGIVTRRANALVIYTVGGEWGPPRSSDFSRQTKDTKAMMGRICRIASC